MYANVRNFLELSYLCDLIIIKIKGYEYWQKVLQIINRYAKPESKEEVIEMYDPRTLKKTYQIVSNKKEEDI